MCVWMEDNFKLILQKWGNILYISPFVDEDDCYVNPRILVETKVLHNIEFKEVVLIEERKFSINVMETGEPSSTYHNLQAKSCPEYGIKVDNEEGEKRFV